MYIVLNRSYNKINHKMHFTCMRDCVYAGLKIMVNQSRTRSGQNGDLMGPKLHLLIMSTGQAMLR